MNLFHYEFLSNSDAILKNGYVLYLIFEKGTVIRSTFDSSILEYSIRLDSLNLIFWKHGLAKLIYITFFRLILKKILLTFFSF